MSVKDKCKAEILSNCDANFGISPDKKPKERMRRHEIASNIKELQQNVKDLSIKVDEIDQSSSVVSSKVNDLQKRISELENEKIY